MDSSTGIFSQLFSIASSFFDALLGLDDFFFTVRTFPDSGFIVQLFPDFFASLGITFSSTDFTLVELLLGAGLPFLLGFKLFKFFSDALPLS